MTQPEGQDHPEQLGQLISDMPAECAGIFLKMLKVQWTPHEILDMLRAELKANPPSESKAP